VGSREKLGAWSAAKALPLTTTATAFPTWWSAAVFLPAGQAVEFKYIVQRADRIGTVKWEGFAGNRVVKPEAGKVLTVEGAWGDIQVALTSMARLGEPGAPGPAESSQLSQKLEDREARRRIFSQSLMSLDVGDGASTSHQPERQQQQQQQQQEQVMNGFSTSDLPARLQPSGPSHVVVQTTLEVEEDQAAHPRGVSLKNIMSFSALSSMADAEDKTASRETVVRRRQYEPYNLNVPVVIVTSEVAPYSKTGGLGLVANSYSYEFPQNGHRTMVVSPKYRHYDGLTYVGETKVVVDGFDEQVKFFHKWVDHGKGKGCDYVFVDHPCIEREGGLYNGDDGKEYEDNVKRFTILSMAAMEAPLILPLGGATYGDKVLFIANDWQSGLVPLLLSCKYRKYGVYLESRVIYVVHNLGYQGRYHIIDACKFFGIDDRGYRDISFGTCINMTKGALIRSDRVITVSPHYAQEIQTPEGGFGLEEVVR
ncbi:unnamed protein product, partial [Polarella glacialis]